MRARSNFRVVLAAVLLGACSVSAQTGTALVRRAPTLNGKVEGSVQVMTAENVTLNGSAAITGDLLLPGTPTVQLNGTPTYGGTRDGDGAATPASHRVTLNGGSSLRHVVRRTDPVPLPTVVSPPSPTGTRSVTLNQAGQSPGDFSTLKHLTLNSHVGTIPVPPGTYGNFTANSGSGFSLGTAGSAAPAHYAFQNLTLNSNSDFMVAGPVVVTVAGGFSTNSNLGNPSNPRWLKLRIAGGGLTVSGGRSVYADLEAPDGTLTLNGSALFAGAAVVERLIVNGNARLRLVSAAPNQPPTAALVSPLPGSQLTQPAAVSLRANATDADGSVVRIEFYDGAAKLGEVPNSDVTLPVTLTTPGPHQLRARAVDNQGAFADSAVVEVRLLAGLPYLAGFEVSEGYRVGSLHDQLGWEVPAGAAEITGDAAKLGLQGVKLSAGAALAVAEQEFGTLLANPSPVFVDLFLRSAATPGNAASVYHDIDNARLAVIAEEAGARLSALDGDGGGNGSWRRLPGTLPLGSDSLTHWLRLTTRLDYSAKSWDVYLNGKLLAHGLRFRFSQAAFFSGLSFRGHAVSATYLDGIYVGPENPIFSDADRDGLDDAWEAERGLNPALNDRDGDADGDGLANILEFALGTHPGRADSDGDEVADGYEVRHALNPLLADGGDDADLDGLSNLLEFQHGTSSSSFDTDSDGLPDALELGFGYDPLRTQPETALNFDADGDRLTLEQELNLGTDPRIRDALNEGDDSDEDGLPDRWEVAHGFDPRNAEPLAVLNADADGDSLGLAIEVLLGSDPNNVDSDGDSMSDGYEYVHELDPVANDAAQDLDGDGVGNADEFRRGSDPNDYYNGTEPEILQFIGGNYDVGVGGVVAVRVADKLGNPLVNAPVLFEITDDDPKVLALTRDGPAVGRTAEVRSGAGGIARIYIRNPTPSGP
jgi:hypothetical protein